MRSPYPLFRFGNTLSPYTRSAPSGSAAETFISTIASAPSFSIALIRLTCSCGSDEMFTKQVICSGDAGTHVQRIKAIEKLGADVMCLMNVSGADPHAALRFYGERVLPELRSDS